MKILIFLLLIDGTTEHEARWDNGNLKEKGELVDGKKEGRWRTWLKGGQPGKLRTSFKYANGKAPTQTQVCFHDDGKTKEYQGKWVKERQGGKWTHWYRDGKKQRETTYKSGIRDGWEKKWDVQGRLVSKVLYKDGRPAKKK